MSGGSEKDYVVDDLEGEEGIELLADSAYDSTGSSDAPFNKLDGIDVNKLINRSLWDDFIDAFDQARYPLLVAILLLIVVGYQVTIGQYRGGPSTGDVPTQHTWDTLKFIRPVLPAQKQYMVNENTLFAETTLLLPNNDAISFKFQPTTDKYGTFQLPELFYQGVFFSIGLGNSHNVDYSSTKTFTVKDMFRRLSALNPKPMYIAPRMSTRAGKIPVDEPELFSNDWSEQGFVVYYSYKQLDAEGLLSSATPTQPWKRLSETLLEVAREFKQMYITVYYANAFGPSDTNQIWKIGERNRQRRLLIEADPALAGKYDLPLSNDDDEEQTNVYYLSRGYDGTFTHSVDRRAQTLIDDEVEHYRRENPKGPRITPKHARPTRTFPKINRKLVEEDENGHGPIINGRTSVMSYVKNDYMLNGRPVLPEERRRRAAEAEAKAESGDGPSASAIVRDSHQHKYENIIQEVLPAFTGLDKIRSKAVVWLSRVNHTLASEVILDTFERLSFDKIKEVRRALSATESFLEDTQEHRRLLRDGETEVSLPHGLNISFSDSNSETDDVEYFDYLMSAKSYNHVTKMESFNVIYSKAWERKLFSEQTGASDSTSFGKQAKHWSEYVPYDVAMKYAKKHGFSEYGIEKPE